MPIYSTCLAGRCVELQVYSVQHVLATSSGYLSIIMPTGCDALLALNISKNPLRLLSSEAAGSRSEPCWNFQADISNLKRGSRADQEDVSKDR